MSVVARQPTTAELAQGYLVCDCGRFVHVFRMSALLKLPRGYYGERCPECNLWMVAVDKLLKEDTEYSQVAEAIVLANLGGA